MSVYTESAKRQSRSVKLKVSSGGDRVVTKSMCGRINLGPLGPTTHQSFHHKRQSQTTDFPVPISGWDGMGNGRHVTLAERNVGICLPSISSGSQSVGEDQSGIGRDHSSSTVVSKKSLVTRPTGVEHGATPVAPTLLGKTANAA